MQLKRIIGNEVLLYFLSIAWFAFVGINVNTTLGLIYYGFPTTAILLTIFDKKKTIKWDKDRKWTPALIQAAGIYIAFILISSLLLPFFTKVNIGGLIKLLGATAPALAQSKILNFFTFWIPVAYVESMSVIRFFDYIASELGIKIDRFTLSTIILIGVFSFGFMLLHATAKKLDNASLMLVFFMMAVSLTSAVYFKEGKQATFFHIYSNGIAGASIFGIFAIYKFIIPLII